MYNRLVERCFSDCVSSFDNKTVSKKEEECLNQCAEKFIKHTQRVGRRFAEQQAQMQQ
jgi:import inner membrane translocase subunit TIM9